MDKSKETERLNKASDWVRNSSVDSPYKKVNSENKWKRLGLNLASKTLSGAKSLVRQGRETLIAADIAKRKLAKDKSVSKKDNEFLKNKSLDTVKALPLAAIEVGSQVIAPGNLVPATKGYIGAAMGAEKLAEKVSGGKVKLDLLPKNRAIPRNYIKKYKTSKVDRFINRKVRALDKAKKELKDD
jgi:hypothetical protein